MIIPDAFRVDFVNNQILADYYASAAQFLVYLPDFMDGKFTIFILFPSLGPLAPSTFPR
jgi:hypothetical protein